MLTKNLFEEKITSADDKEKRKMKSKRNADFKIRAAKVGMYDKYDKDELFAALVLHREHIVESHNYISELEARIARLENNHNLAPRCPCRASKAVFQLNERYELDSNLSF